jgi:hypothetical protein
MMSIIAINVPGRLSLLQSEYRKSPDSGKIKVDNDIRKKVLKLLYPGTGNRWSLFYARDCGAFLAVSQSVYKTGSICLQAKQESRRLSESLHCTGKPFYLPNNWIKAK